VATTDRLMAGIIQAT